MTNRRHFLRIAAGALALPSFCRGAEPASPSLGFSLYGMKSLPLDAALRTCAGIGYSHVELALNAGYPTEPKVFNTAARKAAVDRLESLKLGLPCLMLNISLTADDQAHVAALAQIAEAGQMAHDMAPAAPPLLETVLGGKPATWEQQKAGMTARLRDWATAAEKAKIQIAVKAHVASAVNSPARLLWLIDQVKSPAIVVAYDYSHFELQGIDIRAAAQVPLRWAGLRGRELTAIQPTGLRPRGRREEQLRRAFPSNERMKPTLTLLTVLLLAPLVASQAAPSADARIVVASEAGAKLDSDVNKGGGTDDTALIQSILDRAPKLGSLKLVVDGAILVKGLKVHSNTTIECIGSGSGFFLADHSDRPIIRNADPSATERKNRNLTFLGGTYNGNGAKQAHNVG
ncbi:MAG: TIM barrel protein, partial [Verrucomicrobia bacterium]|nr:TIM barrel protein [Verrucomicrobiota bacterium]